MNLPNKLTFIRFLCVPLFVCIYLIPYSALGINIPSYNILNTTLSLIDIILFIIFVTASITDFLDGYIARKYSLVTTFGKFMDPIADKLIVNCTILLLASSGKIPMIIPILMISRDTIVDAIRLVASQKNIVLAASPLGKLKTVTQMIAIILMLLNNIIFQSFNIPMALIMMWIATVISVISGLDYFMKNKDFILESM